MEENVRERYIHKAKDLFLTAWDRLEGKGDVEKVINGFNVLKKKLLGVCGSKDTKSIDDIAGVLTEIGFASSKDEGKKKVRLLEKIKVLFYDEYKCIIMNKLSEGMYMIRTYTASMDDAELLARRAGI